MNEGEKQIVRWWCWSYWQGAKERQQTKEWLDWLRGKECSICGELFQGHGNNPQPVKPSVDARCCDACNSTVVIPARLKRMGFVGKGLIALMVVGLLLAPARAHAKKAPPVVKVVQGPAGPQGPAGVQGPAGPAGPAGGNTWVTHQGGKSSGEPCMGYGFGPPVGSGQPVESQLYQGTIVAFDNACDSEQCTGVPNSDQVVWDSFVHGNIHLRNDGAAPANVEIDQYYSENCLTIGPSCYSSVVFKGVMQPNEDKFIPFQQVAIKLPAGIETFFVTGTADAGSTITCVSADYQTDENSEGVVP